ncbi:hypothetical protein PV327_002217 [Microctonus hyperodae]|uniref:Uncharacterized protein n=1 Tax=Microctonus hyperodae TaxID=165561 RepID=A0AA39KNY5_MICHY|nr:hypothetical protein PV327_002217 [Microctonus hyperodae]
MYGYGYIIHGCRHTDLPSATAIIFYWAFLKRKIRFSSIYVYGSSYSATIICIKMNGTPLVTLEGTSVVYRYIPHYNRHVFKHGKIARAPGDWYRVTSTARRPGYKCGKEREEDPWSCHSTPNQTESVKNLSHVDDTMHI